MTLFYNIFIFIFGSCIGSFLNVCIYRLPLKESVVYPRSRCPQCKNTIPWYDNIPVLSFLILRRKCRFCKAVISYKYFFVELMTGGLFLLLFHYYGASPHFFIYALLFSSLIIVTFIDLKYMEIPDIISISGIFVGLILSLLYPRLQGTSSHVGALLSSLYGIFAGGASIYVIGVVGKIIFRKEAMGGGDVKLLAMIGAFLGWEMALLTFFIAPFMGAVVGIVVKIRTKESLIPYGPFLSLASLIALLWGNDILNWAFLR